jgi:predicted PurR-regulated permease PerM
LPRLSEGGRRWARFFALLAAIALLVWIALALRQVLTPIVAALALAYILNPVVTGLERKYNLKRVTSISVGLGLLLLIGGALLTAGTAQVVQLASNFPTYAGDALQWVDETFPGLFGPADEEPLSNAPGDPAAAADAPPAATTAPQAATPEADEPLAEPLLTAADREQLIAWVSEHGLTVGRSVVGYIGRLVSNAFYWLSLTLLLPLYTFFFLLRFNEIVQAVRDHLPSAYRPTVIRIVTTIDGAIATFFRGRLVVCILVGTLIGIGWWIAGVPYNLALGALAGTLNLVPFLSVLALPPALLLTYLDTTAAGGNWVFAMTLVAGVYLAVQAIESFLLTPLIEARASGLHPVTTVIALLIGGQLAGLLGMLLAIPITSTLKSLAAEYALPELRRLADAREAATTDKVEEPRDSAHEAAGERPTAGRETANPGDVPPQDER